MTRGGTSRLPAVNSLWRDKPGDWRATNIPFRVCAVVEGAIVGRYKGCALFVIYPEEFRKRFVPWGKGSEAVP